jgi:translation initiation factor eIF-2B subunit beta
VRRVLHIIREEASSSEATGDEGGGADGRGADSAFGGAAGGASELTRCASARVPSLATLLEVSEASALSPGGGPPTMGAGGRRLSYGNLQQRDANAAARWKVRHNILEAVNELIDELDGITQAISEQALEHVHTGEVILTFGYCRTVHLFLREAAKKRNFQVVVAEGAPSYEGQKLARDLANDGCAPPARVLT